MTLSTTVSAGEFKGLYDVEVVVNSQSSDSLRSASAEGLRTVLIRISGNTEAPNQAVVRSALRNAQSYVKQYRYQQRKLAAPQPLPMVVPVQEQLSITLEFERELVDALLRDAGLSLWSGNRPATMMWLALEDSSGRRLVGRETAPVWVEAMLSQSQRRGLPMQVPLLDLEDIAAVPVTEVWSLNKAVLERASQRYNIDALLLGRVTRLNNGTYLGRWVYVFEGVSYEFDAQTDNTKSYIAAAVDPIADLLAEKFAIAPVNMAEGGVLMRITGVNNFRDYARAIAYLENVAAIRQVNVINVAGDEIIVQLVAEGMLSQLQQVLELDKRLGGAVSRYEGGYPITLDYSWAGG